MEFRPMILRLMLCFAFVLASSYVKAVAHVDGIGSHADVQSAKAKLPPCHKALDGESEKDGRHHDGCCSNFACAIGIVVESALHLPRAAAPLHDIDYGHSDRSELGRPLDPPPKPI